MSTTTYASIQGTLTTQLRSPRSPRKQRDAANSKVKCLDCWNPNPKLHPCLFCEKCLASVLQRGTSQSGFYTSRNQTTAGLSPSNSFDSKDSDLTAWEKNRVKSARTRQSGDRSIHDDGNRLRTPRTQEVIINSSLGISENPSHRSLSEVQRENRRPDDAASKGTYIANAQRKRNVILQQKAHDFQRTATRCGLCLTGDSRKKLVVYCIHCRKHLCQEHFEFHCRIRVFRPHATINIQDGTNQGLM